MPTDDEAGMASSTLPQSHSIAMSNHINTFLANRKARLMAPKTIESRIERRNETNQSWRLRLLMWIYADGKLVIRCGLLTRRRTLNYDWGLIAEKKEKA